MKEIVARTKDGTFLDAYQTWVGEQNSREKRIVRLECLAFYAAQDTDQDGIADWSAIADRRPSQVLYPADEDIDGDGTPNLFDPSPFNPAVKGGTEKIPAHLVIRERALQAEIYDKFGILAVDQTDEHSPAVLKNFLFLLEHRPELAKGLKNFRYLFAFAGHDNRVNLAAYHVNAKAISIGGRSAFSSKQEKAPITQILASLAHEMAHAFLLEKMKPGELNEIAEIYGEWPRENAGDFYASAFFGGHPKFRSRKAPGRSLSSLEAGPENIANLVSSYAATNKHEWFAEAMAAAVLVSLGEKGALGTEWRGKLAKKPRNRRHHWVDYTRISPELSLWLLDRLGESAPYSLKNSHI